MTGLRRALIVGAAAAFVTASSSLADRIQTIARARDVAYGREAVGGPDTGTLAAGSRDRTRLLWDAHSDQLGTALNGHAGPVSSVAFSSNGGTLATATENGTVQLWDVRRNTLVGTLKGLTGIVDVSRSVRTGAPSPPGEEMGRSSCGTC